MAAEQTGRDGTSLTRKVLITSGVGLLTFLGSATLDGLLEISVIDQLLLTAMVGGIALLTQFLADFENRISGTQDAMVQLTAVQRDSAASTATAISQTFSNISDAAALFNAISNSPLPISFVAALAENSTLINESGSRLIQDVADYEITRIADTMQSLSKSKEITYEGEDREWLLGLTRHSGESIVALSLINNDSETDSLEIGFWTQDLGTRYLDAQQEALDTHPDMTIRRIFIIDDTSLATDQKFLRATRLHSERGIHTRYLTVESVPHHLRTAVSDFVIFDATVAYETVLATRTTASFKPITMTTRLIIDAIRVRRRFRDFELLWEIADDIGDPARLPR